LSDPTIDPFQVSSQFTYYRRWTGSHFSVQRDLIRSLGMDSGEELRSAWEAIQSMPEKSVAMAVLHALPTVTLTQKDGTKAEKKLTWRTAPEIAATFDKLEYTREWTRAFREQYRQAGMK